ncbi:MAG TPA: ribose-5-phosphate isomerase A, partial [Polyangiaceae bacterium]|nr:ribose-5-phosphate isomerase A [Polyangiaceae bacterium]
MDQEFNKRLAARAALELLPEAGVIGLGTGSTTRYFIEGIAELQRAGRAYVGVPTSELSRSFAQILGMALLDDAGPWDIALCVDGADEVSAGLDLIKGGGGAHAREKIVNFASRLNV